MKKGSYDKMLQVKCHGQDRKELQGLVNRLQANESVHGQSTADAEAQLQAQADGSLARVILFWLTVAILTHMSCQVELSDLASRVQVHTYSDSPHLTLTTAQGETKGLERLVEESATLTAELAALDVPLSNGRRESPPGSPGPSSMPPDKLSDTPAKGLKSHSSAGTDIGALAPPAQAGGAPVGADARSDTEPFALVSDQPKQLLEDDSVPQEALLRQARAQHDQHRAAQRAAEQTVPSVEDRMHQLVRAKQRVERQLLLKVPPVATEAPPDCCSGAAVKGNC